MIESASRAGLSRPILFKYNCFQKHRDKHTTNQAVNIENTEN